MGRMILSEKVMDAMFILLFCSFVCCCVTISFHEVEVLALDARGVCTVLRVVF